MRATARPAPIELEENIVKANGLVGIRVTGSGHQLKKNVSGGTSSGETNVRCEFLSVADPSPCPEESPRFCRARS